MKIVVCVKPTAEGNLSPFDASAYETALRVTGAEVILLSMAPASAEPWLQRLTRLGAERAILLSDAAFAGSDTLATSYVLSLALQKIKPDFVFCGRQTLEGDTGQVGVGVATRMGYAFATRLMNCAREEDGFAVTSRDGGQTVLRAPALLTFERICEIRLPSIFSKVRAVAVWSAADLRAERARIGLSGSPTTVVKSFESVGGKRKCRFVAPNAFADVLSKSLCVRSAGDFAPRQSEQTLEKVWFFGEKAKVFADAVCKHPQLRMTEDPDEIVADVQTEQPDAILFDASGKWKDLASVVATKLETGLCADCTALKTDGEALTMVRPAFGGNRIAEIRCKTKPAIATVRTKSESGEIVFSIGAGAVRCKEEICKLAVQYGAQVTASRAVVDMGGMPYEAQVGLTGKTVAPKVYVAFGISGAVHHLAGMQGAGSVIAVNCDRNAPIFEYADFGIVTDLQIESFSKNFDSQI